MFSVLLESAAPSARRTRWLAGSTAVHALVVTLGVAATVHPLAAGPEPERATEVLVFRHTAPAPTPTPLALATSTPGRSAARPPRFPRLDLLVPHVPVLHEGLMPVLDPDTLLGALVTRGDVSGTVTGDAPGGALSADRVDRAVIAHRSNGAPRYPSALKLAGVEGEVLARFIVDTLGRVEPRSVEIVRAAHGQFADAVRAWLARNRYTPAEVGGRRVRQVVEQRVTFSVATR